MPKQKTHRGAAKRLALTKNGLVKRAKAFKRHILNKKTRKTKRNLRLLRMSPRATRAR